MTDITCGTENNSWSITADENNQITLTFPVVIRVTLPFITWANFRKMCEMFLGIVKMREEDVSKS